MNRIVPLFCYCDAPIVRPGAVYCRVGPCGLMLCRSLFTWEAQPRISDATPELTPELEAIDDATAETVC